VLPPFGNANYLREIEERLLEAPEDVNLLYQRAGMLDLLGRNDEARDAYIAVIKREPAHLGALGSLGTLLFNAGYRSAARLTYGEALKHHPRDVTTLINFANALFENDELAAARSVYESALEVDAGAAPAHQGLSHVLDRLGENEAAERHRQAGFAAMPVSVEAYRGSGLPVSVLILSSARKGNVPIDVPLDDATFLKIKLFTDYYDPQLPLPPHDVIFNGIGDADLCKPSLDAAEALLRRHGAAALNPPECVRETGRAAMAAKLRGIAGLIVPRIVEIGRGEIDTVDTFPALVRPPGYHTGEFFERVSDRAELKRLAPTLPGEKLLVIEQLDARAADGFHRKYRFLAIGGRLYPVHLARSSHWKVHYFSADRVRDPEAIAEEDAFLTDPRAAIGERAMAVIGAAIERIGLDYCGIDFALDAAGNVLFFEGNATMRAVVPVAGDGSQAKRAAAVTANRAFRDMVLRTGAA